MSVGSSLEACSRLIEWGWSGRPCFWDSSEPLLGHCSMTLVPVLKLVPGSWSRVDWVGLVGGCGPVLRTRAVITGDLAGLIRS